jgi:hypothetical protein
LASTTPEKTYAVRIPRPGFPSDSGHAAKASALLCGWRSFKQEVSMKRLLMSVMVLALCSGCSRSGPGQAAGLAGPAAPTSAAVSVPLNFRTHLNGRDEVPVRETRAQGQATFQVQKDGVTIEYKLIASNIDNVTQAHIHQGPADGTGPIVVWLFPNTAPPANPGGGGRHDGVLREGTFTAANFIGPLAGKSAADLIALMRNGGVYVNVHTSDGVDPPNTGPGDFPGGEIRGQI